MTSDDEIAQAMIPLLYDEFRAQGPTTPEFDLWINVILSAVRDYTSCRVGSAGRSDARKAWKWLNSDDGAEVERSFRWILNLIFSQDPEGVRVKILKYVHNIKVNGGGEFNLQYGIWKRVRRKRGKAVNSN